MRIYLGRDYHRLREIAVGKASPTGPVVIVRVVHDTDDRDRFVKKFYVEGDERVEKVLGDMGMLLSQEKPIANPGSSEIHIDESEKTKLPDSKSDKDLPDSYLCKVHNRVHKKGSSQYIACFDKNFKLPE